MKGYRETKKEQLKVFEKEIKQKASKPISLEHQINLLYANFSILMMEDLMAAIRVANGEELFFVRNKLTKL